MVRQLRGGGSAHDTRRNSRVFVLSQLRKQKFGANRKTVIQQLLLLPIHSTLMPLFGLFDMLLCNMMLNDK